MRKLLFATAAVLIAGSAHAAVYTYDFTGPTAGTNTLLGASQTYTSAPPGAPTITLTAGTYSGAVGTPASTTFSSPAAFRLVGNNRGADEQGVGVCGAAAPFDCSDLSTGPAANQHALQGNGEIDYSTKEVVRVDLTPLIALYGNVKVNADSATGGEQMGVYSSNSATNIGAKLLDLTSASGNVDITPTGNFLFFIADTNQNTGDVLLHSMTVSSVPEPFSLAVLGSGLVGLGLARRRTSTRRD